MKSKILCLLLSCTLLAQAASSEKGPKPEKVSVIIKDAQTAIKNRTGQAAVQKRILQAAVREDVSNKNRCALYFTAAELDESMNEIENRKAYLGQAYDTAQFFNTLLNMYANLELCDSVDHVPNAKGIAQPRYSKRTATLRGKYRKNILNGGKFYLKKQNTKQALRYFDTYFVYRPDGTDPELDKVVVWAVLCSYDTKQHDKTLFYADRAIDVLDSTRRPIIQEFKTITYKALNNDSLWLDALRTGVRHYPAHDYFFVNLVDYYGQHKMLVDGYNLCDSLIAIYPERELYWYAKSKFALIDEDFDHSIEYADKAISLQPEHADAHYNRAISYLNLALIAQENACTDMRKAQFQKDRQHIQSLYQAAKPSMELVRQHEPNNKERWAAGLYRIYLNLNMGKEFEEIDRLMHQ